MKANATSRKRPGRRAGKRAKSTRPAQPRWRRWLSAVAWRFGLLALVVGVGWIAWLDLSVRAQFDGKRWALPARVYARPLEIFPAKSLTPEELRRELELAGYHRRDRVSRPGDYAEWRGVFEVLTRGFRFWDGAEPARHLRLRLRDRTVTSLSDNGEALALARLEPALIGRLHRRRDEDRILVRLAEVPLLLIAGLIAVEDRDYYQHVGVSPWAIARAAYANLRAGAAVQGGSTLTQQLAKNFFLSADKTLIRKLNEAGLAVLLELHYDKAEILEAYLNEIYLGQQGARAVHGFGLAAWYYFRRPLGELRLPEMALLIAQVRGASYYNPRRHPDRARERRNLVLDLMLEQGVIDTAEAARAKDSPLGIAVDPPAATTPHPAYLHLVRRQLARDYRDEDLQTEGLRVFTSLDPRVQRVTEEAVTRRIQSLEKRARLDSGELEAAVVVTSANNGEILAVVGGRAPRQAGFNRALDARRPIGSLVKPAVYLAALEQPQRYTLISELSDTPVRVRGPRGQLWAPQNYDGSPHGNVSLLDALVRSYNLATVRLGMAIGLPKVVDALQRLGVDHSVAPYPSVLLGAVSLSPLEVAQVYQTLASGGFRSPLRAIRAVTDAEGRALNRYGLHVEQTFDAGPVFLLTHAMGEVMRRGTGRSVRNRLDPALGLAGKTGTTDGHRDSWFAGFSPETVAVVWLGRDDNGSTGLTGASGALQVWGDLMNALRPRARRTAMPPPDIEWHWTDVPHQRRTDAGCRNARRIPYLRGTAPAYIPCATAGAPAEPIPERETG